MSILQRIRYKIQTAMGRGKKSTGLLTGNRRLRTEGRADQAAGNVKQAANRVKAAFKH